MSPLDDPRLLPRATPESMELLRKNVPAELRALPHWVLADRSPKVMGDGSVKSSKVPLDPKNTWRNAKSNDPSTWGAFELAVKVAPKEPKAFGVGVNLLGTEFIGLDLDHVIDPDTGDLAAAARTLIDTLPRTYTETSPSGTGLRVFFRGSLPANLTGSVTDGAFGPGTQLECYDGARGARYLTVTGAVFEGRTQLVNAGDADLQGLVDLAQQARQRRNQAVVGRLQRAPTYDPVEDLARARWALLDQKLLDPSMGYHEWIRVLAGLRALGDEGLMIAEEWSSGSAKYVPGEPAEKCHGLDGSSPNSLFGMLDDAAPDWRSRYRDARGIGQQGKSADSAKPAAPDGRPVVRCDETEFHDLLEIAVRSLAARDDVAVCNGEIVHVFSDPHGGSPRVRPASHGLLREILSREVLWTAERGRNQFAVVNPPIDVVHALAEQRHSWPAFRKVDIDDDAACDWESLAEEETPPMLIEGWLSAGGMTIIGGHSNAGKTYLAIDGVMRLAHGMGEFLGLKIAGPASTLYLAAEGRPGIPKRVRAWKAAHPQERMASGCYVSIKRRVPNLTDVDAADALLRLVDEAAEQHGGQMPAVVVLDTLAAAVPGGDESGAEAFGAAVHALGALLRRGIAVIIVHHLRKQGQGDRPSKPSLHDFRGSSVLIGAADVGLVADGQAVHMVKSRDDGRSEPVPYSIVPQPTGRGTEVGAVVLPAPRIVAATPPDMEQTPEAARLSRRVAQVVHDAATVSVVLARYPGRSLRRLRADAAAIAGGMARDRVDVALARLGSAVVIFPGPRDADLHYLVGDQVPADVIAAVPVSDRPAVLASRPDPHSGGPWRTVAGRTSATVPDAAGDCAHGGPLRSRGRATVTVAQSTGTPTEVVEHRHGQEPPRTTDPREQEQAPPPCSTTAGEQLGHQSINQHVDAAAGSGERVAREVSASSRTPGPDDGQPEQPKGRRPRRRRDHVDQPAADGRSHLRRGGAR